MERRVRKLFGLCLTAWLVVVSLSAAPVESQFNLPQFRYEPSGGWVQDAYAYWHTFLSFLPGASTQQNPSSAETSSSSSAVGFGVSNGQTYENDRLVEEARLHVVELLLNMTMDTYYEMEGADAQAVAYDYDDTDDEYSESESVQQPIETSDIITKVVDRIRNATTNSDGTPGGPPLNFTERSKSKNLTEDNIRVIRAIEKLPNDLQDIFRSLNQTLNETQLFGRTDTPSKAAQRLNFGGLSNDTDWLQRDVAGSIDLDDAGLKLRQYTSTNTTTTATESATEGPNLQQESVSQNATNKMKENIENVEECVISDLIQQEDSCLGQELQNQDDVCFVSIIKEALREANFVESINGSAYSVLFMPSDSAILRMLKFAQVSPQQVLRDPIMNDVVNRHSLLYESSEFEDLPLVKMGIAELLTSNTNATYTVLDMPTGSYVNAPNITLMMERQLTGISSLYIATKKPGCQLEEYNVEESVAVFYNAVNEACMSDYLRFCLDPSFQSNLPDISLPDSGISENPCGLAQLLGVKVCKDGIVLPVNDLLFDSEQTANFLALLIGATLQEGSEQEKAPAFHWSLAESEGSLHSNVTHVPEVQVNKGTGMTFCFSATPNANTNANSSELHSPMVSGLSDRWNFTINAHEVDSLRRLAFQGGPVNFTSRLVLQDQRENNIAIVIDDTAGSWSFYDNGWLIERKLEMPQLPSFLGELSIGGARESSHWEGLIHYVKIFEDALLPEDIARLCKQDEEETYAEYGTDSENADQTRTEANSTTAAAEAAEEELDQLLAQTVTTSTEIRSNNEGGNSFGPMINPNASQGLTCNDRIAQHLKLVSPALLAIHDPQSTTLGVLSRGDGTLPEYFYKLSEDGSNSGMYNLSSAAESHYIDRDCFTPNGVHFDGLNQHMILPDIALAGNNVSIGFTMSLDTFERVHQTVFQLISECEDSPLNLYLQVKVHSEITGLDKDYFQVSLNGELTSIEVDQLQKRSPIAVALVFEGLSWSLYVDCQKVGTFSGESPSFPAVFGRAKLGSENAFAGMLGDLFIYDRAISSQEIESLCSM
jgi:hypothetical protein